MHCERGYSREQIVRLFKIIDWMIQLPRELEPGFVQAVYAIQEEKKMPYVNTIERVEREKALQQGMAQGLEQGREQGVGQGRQLEARRILQRQLRKRFGDLPHWVSEQLEAADVDQLEAWSDEILFAESLDTLLRH
ncbi:DUF4351 domain-containing protein [Ectothiorhodospira sp. 9100]|uniref:DUF4351 domain-containing protein n=1 Tax=Ectothiorhodospira sp. 9100 TaxID=2897388 RepID=UPI001EE7FBEF|nr:DUF4351 domain-containing protein [Ectothiorhodospira sp. 9100]MCG5517234.1 DUF4351 domain-containing protein [Ectothiorhodospira sp. 9100]